MADTSLQLDLSVEDSVWADDLPALFDTSRQEASDRLLQTASYALSRGRGARFAGKSISIAMLLASDHRVASLNKQFRNKTGSTNILSFPDGSESGEPDVVHLGDLALARETVFREATEQRKSALHHTLHLVVHGILHLLGYDHQSDEMALEMETLERHILADLGIADPYEPGGAAQSGTPTQGKGPCNTESTAFPPR